MAATNQTSNYGLPQWLGSDKLERTDMNTAMADIDDNLNLVDNTVAAHLAESTTQQISITRDVSVGGAQIVSGFNAIPKGLYVVANINNTVKHSIGLVDENGNQLTTIIMTDGNSRRLEGAIAIAENTANVTIGTITINNDRTITINWAKIGSGGTGTAAITILAIYHGGE